MFGLTADEAETVQTDPDAAVQLLVIRQLEGLAAAGRRVVLLVDALDGARTRDQPRREDVAKAGQSAHACALPCGDHAAATRGKQDHFAECIRFCARFLASAAAAINGKFGDVAIA